MREKFKRQDQLPEHEMCTCEGLTIDESEEDEKCNPGDNRQALDVVNLKRDERCGHDHDL